MEVFLQYLWEIFYFMAADDVSRFYFLDKLGGCNV